MMLESTALAASPGLVLLFSTALGLTIGSFLNVVIHRLPIMMERDWRMQARLILDAEASSGQQLYSPPNEDRDAADLDQTFNLSVPRSRCPHCGHQITALENIPVLSWLFLRGRCSDCRAPISARYPAIELLTGVITGYLFFSMGLSEATLLKAVLCWCLIALTFIDFDTQYLPDSITLPLMWLGLFTSVLGLGVPLNDAVIGAMVGYLSLWSIFWIFKLLTGKEGFGYGDFKLLAAMGAWLGWSDLPMLILIASGLGSIIGLSMIYFTSHERQQPFAFGPYLALAGIVMLFWGDRINALYLGTVY